MNFTFIMTRTNIGITVKKLVVINILLHITFISTPLSVVPQC